jgi:hypothetical protein
MPSARGPTGSYWSERGNAVSASLIRNRMILERLGCLDAAGMEKLRTGKAPTITRGPYARIPVPVYGLPFPQFRKRCEEDIALVGRMMEGFGQHVVTHWPPAGSSAIGLAVEAVWEIQIGD